MPGAGLLLQVNFPLGQRAQHEGMSSGGYLMFMFFDLFAKTLNFEPGRPRDSFEERREASIGARRVQARRRKRAAALQRDV